MLNRCWDLSEKQKIFLENQGVDHKEYKIVGATASDYKFYNVITKKILSIRR